MANASCTSWVCIVILILGHWLASLSDAFKRAVVLFTLKHFRNSLLESGEFRCQTTGLWFLSRRGVRHHYMIFKTFDLWIFYLWKTCVEDLFLSQTLSFSLKSHCVSLKREDGTYIEKLKNEQGEKMYIKESKALQSQREVEFQMRGRYLEITKIPRILAWKLCFDGKWILKSGFWNYWYFGGSG